MGFRPLSVQNSYEAVMKQITTLRLPFLIRTAIPVLLSALFAFTPAAADTVKIVAFGDSLTAGYGLPPGEAFPDRLAQSLAERGHDVEIINAGVSGDTASGGADRLDWIVTDDVDAVIVELGANDALRGLSPDITRQALDSILQRLKDRNIGVLLAGMLAPPNMGADYGNAFNSIYPELAKKHDAILYPFFLDGVAADPSLNLADGIHPNQKGIAVIVERILPFAEELIRLSE